MSENKIDLENPLTKLGFESEDIVQQGQMGAICARAGVGKTSFVVQVAIYAMARGKKVLHISLDEPVNKINLWYREVFNPIAAKNNIPLTNIAWDSILTNRLIMTLQLDGFSVPRLEERLADLIEQNIFCPETVVIDGFPFPADRTVLKDLKALGQKMNMNVWFTVTTHRHEEPMDDGMPIQLDGVQDLFSTIFQLVPEQKTVNLNVLKGACDTANAKSAFVDPVTMLISK
ncbi:MAG: AAA family ATPase [Proteobacteria bacterium]|nr:AAA family ATPase [Pseudomonadota bacterium]